MSHTITNVPTIMIVEDDPAFTYLMRRYVERSGCRPISTSHSRKALSLAKAEMPAVIVLDVMLPEMDGWDVLEELRSDPATSNVPVVLCTALEEEKRGQAEGAAAFLRKPVMYHDFWATLVDVGIVEA